MFGSITKFYDMVSNSILNSVKSGAKLIIDGAKLSISSILNGAKSASNTILLPYGINISSDIDDIKAAVEETLDSISSSLIDNNIGVKGLSTGAIQDLQVLLNTFPNNLDYNHLPQNAKYIINYNGAKKDFDSISKMVDTVSAVNKQLPNETVSTTKEWVQYFKNNHPKVTQRTKQLDYFKQFSEDIASRTLGFTPDIYDLELEDWPTYIPRPIRNNVKYKLNANTKGIVEDAYKDLNKRALINTSTEFTEVERGGVIKKLGETLAIQGRLTDPKNRKTYAHDFHLAGDIYYLSDTLPRVIPLISAALGTKFKDTVRLINYLYPVNNSERADIGVIEVDIEKKPVAVNYKGDKQIGPARAINNDPITPEKNI